jgi:hypothetical protein
MDATDYDSQVQELVDGGHFDEAISILEMLEDALLKNKTQTLREIKMLKAEGLFKKKKYRQAMDLFNEDTVHAPPERVLKMFPPSIAGELSAWAGREEEEEQQESDEAPGTPKKTNGTRPTTPEPAEPAHETPQSSKGGFARYLTGSYRRPQADTASIFSKKETNEGDDAVSVKDNESNDDLPLKDKDLTNAVLELNSYLAGTRARLQRVIDPNTGNLKPRSDRNGSTEEIAENFLRIGLDDSEKKLEEELRNTFRLVDTTLFRAYMYSRPTLASSLFRIPNFCDPNVVNEKLLEHNRYTELVDFFYGKKLHKEALELLRRFGAAEKPDEAAPALHGPERTIQYLKSLPPSEIDLILDHAEWTLKASPDDALEIFTGDTENAENLPRDRIVSFLHDVDTQLERRYLEHIINELEDTTPDLQNRLVELYVENLRKMDKGEKWDELMNHFVEFLRQPGHVYSLTKAFGLIPRDGKMTILFNYDLY